MDGLYRESNAKQIEIARLKERVAVGEGKISVAENTLSSIRDAANSIAGGALAIGADALSRDVPGAVRSGTAMAITLAREESRQRQEIVDLRRQLADHNWQLQSERNELSIIERDISQTIHFLNANNCR